jgi:hypothetical protein
MHTELNELPSLDLKKIKHYLTVTIRAVPFVQKGIPKYGNFRVIFQN